MADSIHVTYDLTKLHCVDEGDGSGNAEPFMWTVFFKIDGDTVKVNDSLKLEGTATVVTTQGDHADILGDVDAGDDRPITPWLGHFATTLKPIPTPIKGLNFGGVVGCLAIVMEEDSTPDDAIAAGHKALNKTLKAKLDDLIPTFSSDKKEPTQADIDAIEKAIKKAVSDAVADEVDAWEFLGGLFGNLQDDVIGFAKFIHSYGELDKKAGTSFAVSEHWSENESEDGSWTLYGKVTVGKELVTGIARGGNWANTFLFGKTTAQFVDQNQKLFDEKGLRLVHLATWKDFAGVQRWASVHRSGNWGHRLKVGLTTPQVLEKHAAFEADGYGLERLAYWYQDGQVRWAGGWRTGLPDTSVVHGLDTAAFTQKVQYLFDNRQMRLMQALCYFDNGWKWAGVFQVGNQAHRFYIRDSLATFRAAAQKYFDEDGLRIIDFETWADGAGVRHYAGISISGDWASRMWTNKGVETFRFEKQKAFDDDGLRLTNIDVFRI